MLVPEPLVPSALCGDFSLLYPVLPPPQPAVHVQGQEPLTASMLAAAPLQEQKQMLGKHYIDCTMRAGFGSTAHMAAGGVHDILL